jgi:hypothetical protein
MATHIITALIVQVTRDCLEDAQARYQRSLQEGPTLVSFHGR